MVGELGQFSEGGWLYQAGTEVSVPGPEGRGVRGESSVISEQSASHI